MTLVSSKTMLKNAYKGGYAVGAFNTSNLEITQAIIHAANELNAPVMVQTSTGAIKYAGLKPLYHLVKGLADQVRVPVAIHLDHGPDVVWARSCLKGGWTSIMIDSSSLPFDQNLATAKKVVEMAKPFGAQVEAEIGTLAGIEDHVNVSDQDARFTDAHEAQKFAKKSKIHSLAVAVGTSHGAFKFSTTPRLAFKRLKEIDDLCQMPLVLHGASSVPQQYIRMANAYGAKIQGAKGVPEAQVKKAIKLGVCKINTDTDLRLGFTAVLRKDLKENPKDFNPRSILDGARDAMKEFVKHRIRAFGSEGKA